MIFQYLSEAREAGIKVFSKQSTTTHPGKYFELLSHMASISYKLVFVKVLWANVEKFCKIVNFLQESNSLAVFQYRNKVS